MSLLEIPFARIRWLGKTQEVEFYIKFDMCVAVLGVFSQGERPFSLVNALNSNKDIRPYWSHIWVFGDICFAYTDRHPTVFAINQRNYVRTQFRYVMRMNKKNRYVRCSHTPETNRSNRICIESNIVQFEIVVGDHFRLYSRRVLCPARQRFSRPIHLIQRLCEASQAKQASSRWHTDCRSDLHYPVASQSPPIYCVQN